MNIESGPKFNKTESSSEKLETPESDAEKKDYQLERFSTGWKALGAFDIGMLSTFKEVIFTSEEKWEKREKETGSRGVWALKNLGEKAFKGYQAMEKAGEIIDEGKFQEILAEYEEKIDVATSEEERQKLQKELEDIKDSRGKKLIKEKREHNVRNSLFGTFAKVLK